MVLCKIYFTEQLPVVPHTLFNPKVLKLQGCSELSWFLHDIAGYHLCSSPSFAEMLCKKGIIDGGAE